MLWLRKRREGVGESEEEGVSERQEEHHVELNDATHDM